MTISETTQATIVSSKLSAKYKTDLVSLFPSLGNYTLQSLQAEVSKFDSELIGKDILETWRIFSRTLENLKNKDINAEQNFLQIIEKAQFSLNNEFKLQVLSLVLDVNQLSQTQQISLGYHVIQQILDYQIDLFWNLPKEAILFFLKNHLLDLLNRLDVVKEIQVVTFDNNWDLSQTFSKEFSDCLLNNNETLGQTGKTVGQWVRQFIEFSSIALPARSILQISDFLVKDTSVVKLINEDRILLGEILKLFLWFLKPEINEDEVYKHKEEVRERVADKIEQELVAQDVQVLLEPQQYNLHPAGTVRTFVVSPPSKVVGAKPDAFPAVSLKQPTVQKATNGESRAFPASQNSSLAKSSVLTETLLPKPGFNLGQKTSGGVNLQDMLNKGKTSAVGGISSFGSDARKTSLPAPKIPRTSRHEAVVVRPDALKNISIPSAPRPQVPAPRQMTEVSIDERLANLKKRKKK